MLRAVAGLLRKAPPAMHPEVVVKTLTGNKVLKDGGRHAHLKWNFGTSHLVLKPTSASHTFPLDRTLTANFSDKDYKEVVLPTLAHANVKEDDGLVRTVAKIGLGKASDLFDRVESID